jgi:hypothetical protein
MISARVGEVRHLITRFFGTEQDAIEDLREEIKRIHAEQRHAPDDMGRRDVVDLEWI